MFAVEQEYLHSLYVFGSADSKTILRNQSVRKPAFVTEHSFIFANQDVHCQKRVLSLGNSFSTEIHPSDNISQ